MQCQTECTAERVAPKDREDSSCASRTECTAETKEIIFDIVEEPDIEVENASLQMREHAQSAAETKETTIQDRINPDFLRFLVDSMILSVL